MRLFMIATLALLSGCTVTGAPDDRNAELIEGSIVAACTASGLFRAVAGVASIALPIAALPIAVIEAGVDVVCRDPARFAYDAATVEWVVRNLPGS